MELRGRTFDVHDLLPFVAVARGETPVVLEGLDVSVVVTGMFAETTQTLTFRNPNVRALEGTLTFPLPADAVVCGYAIDLDGALVDGVIVPKQEARRILETEIRKGVDPGLVEQVQGNVYRTRIYPLPPGGTRTIRIVYVSDLACDGTSAAYHLPLAHAKDIARVTLRVEIAKGDVVPEISGALGNLSLAKLRDAFVAEATLPRGTACDDLLIKLPDLPRHLRAVERRGDETFFALSSALPEGMPEWSPMRVALLWDASGSRADVERDLAFVSALFDAWPKLVVDVRVLRDVVDGEARSFAGRGELGRLLAFLRETPRDGGTCLTAFDPRALPHEADEAWLVFGDGLGTIGRGLPPSGDVPIFTCSSAAHCDASYLRHLASRSGGVHIDLLQTPAVAAARLLATARASLRVVGAVGCEDVHVRRASGRLFIVGRLTAEIGQVQLAGSGAPSDHVSIPRAAGVEGRLVARSWAGQQARVRALVDPDDPEVLELGRRFGVVTADASLLVLETLEQHLEYDLEPAASRTALREAFQRARKEKRHDELATKSEHLEQIVTLWQERVRWWETKFEPRPVEPPKHAKRSAPRPAPAVMNEEERTAVLDEPMMAMAAFSPPMPMASAPLAGMAMREIAPAAEADVQDKEQAAPAPVASIQIKPWSADTPYLTALKKAADPYAAYLRARAEYAASPAFFLDCGDFFLARDDRALGLRVLSNLLELGLDDPALMRMYAWRLQQAGELDAAIDVFERVRRLRADEPQSHRDLALALAERWEKTGDAADVTRAMGLLYDVIEQEWERFPEIELIALMELNRLIAKAGERGVRAPERIDPRLVKHLDLDLRISMSWDLDLTDVDLHVFEPNGEHAYYGQNLTSGGGLVSRDFRQGYGPEEYVRRRAAPGVYTIKAHYYGSHQQDVAGACTVIVHVFVNFARPDEQRQVLTLRLDRPSDQVRVGEVTFAGPPAPTDGRQSFRKLRKGMTIDEISAVVGQPARIEGTEQTTLVYEPAPGVVVHVVVAPRLVAVRQIMDGATLDLV